MKILPISSINTKNTQFKAKFPKQDIKEFLSEVKECDVDTVPQLYTMLDFIKKQSGQKAEILHTGLWHQILIDGKSLTNGIKYFCAVHALKDATVSAKNTLVKAATPIKRMTEEEFEKAYYNNRERTLKDIEALFS